MVVIDVLRATSAICTALENGVERIKPVASVTAAEEWKAKGHIGAAERNGEIVPGFDLGNSPIAYIERKEELAGKSVVLTTTNGTKAIDIASEKDTVVIGALNNLNALCDWLLGVKQYFTSSFKLSLRNRRRCEEARKNASMLSRADR